MKEDVILFHLLKVKRSADSIENSFAYCTALFLVFQFFGRLVYENSG
jgi:hypothetical protein